MLTMKDKTIILAAALAALSGCGDKTPSLGGGDKRPSFRLAPITRSDVVRTVEATGTVTPRNTSKGIPVGAQVNGKVIKLFVDYNSAVTNGQIVALIDPLVYEATYKSAVAQLHVNRAGGARPCGEDVRPQEGADGEVDGVCRRARQRDGGAREGEGRA